jgi:DNA ligase (NAD+)
LGEETIVQLVQNDLIHNASDLYYLKAEQLLPLERMAQKSVDNLLDGVEKSKSQPFEKVLFGLGIRHVGEVVAKKMARYFGSWEKLTQASFEELCEVPEIGQIIALSVKNYLENPEHLHEVARLQEAGLNFSASEEELASRTEKLKGKSIVVSGVFQTVSRDELKKLIEDNGGKNVSSISSKTDFVVAGDNMGPSKKDKAESLNIPLLSEVEFLKMLE